ncbi:MAG: methyltransferase domain-containing protein [Planctomycetaceae bacterium]|nr:methyltransferase domain-containing protein [Planctomycetaceae bacterium]
MSADQPTLNVAEAVRSRYSRAAQEQEPSLCCPVTYDPQRMKVIPAEILERDYGCGDPSQHLQPGDRVLDLGSGGGKICYIAAQVVGPDGYVIGVDVNDEMLNLARQYQQEVGDRIGYHNTEFRKGRIQDLRLDLDQFDEFLRQNPAGSVSDWLIAVETADQLRREQPMIPDESIDAVVSNCVLNLVDPESRLQLFAEIHRVLNDGGRAVISDIVSDEDVPAELQNDPELWSGCLSGAFREDRFLTAFEQAGFHGVEILARQEEPWAVIDGIEFRSLTVRAWKQCDTDERDRHQAVIYHGPWKAVMDDAGQELLRGERIAVSDRAFERYQRAPYVGQMTFLSPTDAVSDDEAEEFTPRETQHRDPQQSKFHSNGLNILPEGDCCGTTGCC